MVLTEEIRYIVHTYYGVTLVCEYRIALLTGAECVPIGGSGLTHLVVSDDVEPDNIPVTSSRVMVVKQQVCLLCLCVCLNFYKQL